MTTQEMLLDVLGRVGRVLPGQCRVEGCTFQAEFILWGKLIPPEHLGPRCYDHASLAVGHSALGDPSWAIYDLRPTLEAIRISEQMKVALAQEPTDAEIMQMIRNFGNLVAATEPSKEGPRVRVLGDD